MSVYLRITSKSRELSRVQELIDYVFDEYKTIPQYCHTSGVGRQSAYEDMVFIKNLHHKTEGRQVLHWILSFDKGVSAELADAVGMEVLHFLMTRYQAVCATHTNTSNVHIHYAINPVDIETGKKFSESKKDMLGFRDKINEVLTKFNLKKIAGVDEMPDAKWNEQEINNSCDVKDKTAVLPFSVTEMAGDKFWTGNGTWENGQLCVPGILRETSLIRGVMYDDGAFTVHNIINGEVCTGHGVVENGKVINPGVLYAEISDEGRN